MDASFFLLPDIIKKRLLLFSVLSAMISLVFFIFAVLSAAGIDESNYWENYRLILVEKEPGKDMEKAAFLLDCAFRAERLLSRYTAEIEFTDYENLVYAPLYSLKNRFNRHDPRYDDFMKKALSFFHAEGPGSREYEVFYLDKGTTYSAARKKVASTLGNSYEWVMPGGEPLFLRFYASAVFLVAVSVFIINDRKNTKFYIIQAALLLAVILLNSKTFFYQSIVILFLTRYLLILRDKAERKYVTEKLLTVKQYMDKKGILFSASIVLSFLFMPFFAASGSKGFFSVFYLLMHELFLLASFLLLSADRVAKYCHRIFYNTVISPVKKAKIFTFPLLQFCVIYILAAGAAPFYYSSNSIKYPVPAGFYSYPEEMVTLGIVNSFSEVSEKGEVFPDFSDYVKHLAYQNRLPYTADYSIPSHNEEIMVSYYVTGENQVRHEKRGVNRFTDSWLIDSISIGEERGITGLLLGSKGLIIHGVAGTSPGLCFLIPAIFVFIYPLMTHIFFKGRTTEKTGFHRIISLIKRRKQQAA